jgi:3-hydroxyisobutyrate dehydrogenase-like beta-hydroxyacid dehydrogenase
MSGAIMIIVFIGFGKVSQNLVGIISSDDIDFVTSAENRSSETIDSIEKSNVEALDTFKEVALKSDILISATSPKNALGVARQYGKYAKGIYLDLNNISPDTILEISKSVENLVDGAIIGKIDSDSPVLYLSGEKASSLEFLNDFIQTKIISDKAGDASKLKLLRSSYTKALSALLIESAEIAKSSGLEDEFFDMLCLTEGDDFRQKALSRIHNTINASKRKSEELEEIIDYFDENELIMVKAASEKLSQYQP